MSSLQIPLHGRNHRPGGSDPIPAAPAALDWAYLWRTADRTYANNVFASPFDASTTGAESDATVLDADVTNGVIEIYETGIYLAQLAGSWTITFTGDKTARINFALDNVVAPDFARQIVNEVRGDFDVCAMVVVQAITAGSPPLNNVSCTLGQQSGSDKVMNEVQLTVVRLSAYP